MRAFAPVWKRLVQRYSPMGFDFVIVYILEAHAQDEWNISSSRHHPDGRVVRVDQPKTMEERKEAAGEFAHVFDLFGGRGRILVDDMDDTFNSIFAAWPFRYYVLDGLEVQLVGMPDDRSDGDTFSSEPLESFLSLNYDLGGYSEHPDARVRGQARMMHFSSGRRGYADLRK